MKLGQEMTQIHKRKDFFVHCRKPRHSKNTYWEIYSKLVDYKLRQNKT